MDKVGSGGDFTDLANRAWTETLAGRYAQACELYDQLLVDRQTVGDLCNRGVTCLLMGDLDEALCDFMDARLLPGKAKSVNELVGTTLWLMGNRIEACEDWANEIRRKRSKELTYFDSAGGVEVPALLWWASVRLDASRWRSFAEDELRRRQRTRQCRESEWPGPIVPVLLGERDTTELLSAAANTIRYVGPRQMCQAHFYIAARQLAAGDTGGYIRHIMAAIAPNAESHDGDYRILKAEYHLARSEKEAGGPLR